MTTYFIVASHPHMDLSLDAMINARTPTRAVQLWRDMHDDWLENDSPAPVFGGAIMEPGDEVDGMVDFDQFARIYRLDGFDPAVEGVIGWNAVAPCNPPGGWVLAGYLLP